MRSFKLKTVLLSISLSGILLMTTGFFGWKWLLQEFKSSLDSKIILPGQRIVEYHGWKTDWAQFEETIDMLIGEEWKNDRILKVCSNMYNRGTLYESQNWPTDIETQDIPRFEELKSEMNMIKHPEGQRFIRFKLIDAPYSYSTHSPENQWRMASLTNAELTLYIGINSDRYHAKINRLRLLYFGGLVLVVGLIGVGAYLISFNALKPVRVIAQTAKQITSRDLDQRIPSRNQFDQEFDTLIEIINEMMGRLETSFRQAMRFSSDASHELKTPLAIIQGEISSRLQNEAIDTGEQETLIHVQEEVQRLKRIIKSLFLLSQADAGKMPLTFEEVDFSIQLQGLARDAHFLAEEIGLEFNEQIEVELVVCADPLMLGQVVQNLINNAINYNHRNGFIKIQLRVEGSDMLFRIENSGQPIEEEDTEKIFKRFHRGAQSRKTQTPGLGLGLSLAREIIEAHRGILILEKSDSTSTVFQFSIPIKQAVLN